MTSQHPPLLREPELRTILRIGNPILRAVATPAEPGQAGRTLLDDMIVTMRAARGIGLAAPQIGVGHRAFVWLPTADRSENPADIVPMGLLNPVVTPLDGPDEMGLEGCLSIPELRGLVPRWHRIGLFGFTADGDRIERELVGLQARVVQHELDHLDGILYLDRMRDMSSLGYAPELIEAEAAAADAAEAILARTEPADRLLGDT
jgi:peptide deformylase